MLIIDITVLKFWNSIITNKMSTFKIEALFAVENALSIKYIFFNYLSTVTTAPHAAYKGKY